MLRLSDATTLRFLTAAGAEICVTSVSWVQLTAETVDELVGLVELRERTIENFRCCWRSVLALICCPVSQGPHVVSGRRQPFAQ